MLSSDTTWALKDVFFEVKQGEVDGPVGVHSRNFSHARIESLGWRAQVFLEEGLARTYPWIEAQVRKLRISNCGLSNG